MTVWFHLYGVSNVGKSIQTSLVAQTVKNLNDLEDKMVKITAAEENTEKRMKRNEDSLRDLWDNIKHTNIRIISVPEGEEKKDLKKYLKRYSWKLLKHGKGNSQPSLGSTESPGQDKPNEEHTETYSNQTDKN